MGVVVRRSIDILIIIINFPYSTCISPFFGSSILTSLFIFKMFLIYSNTLQELTGVRDTCTPKHCNYILTHYKN